MTFILSFQILKEIDRNFAFAPKINIHFEKTKQNQLYVSHKNNLDLLGILLHQCLRCSEFVRIICWSFVYLMPTVCQFAWLFFFIFHMEYNLKQAAHSQQYLYSPPYDYKKIEIKIKRKRIDIFLNLEHPTIVLYK